MKPTDVLAVWGWSAALLELCLTWKANRAGFPENKALSAGWHRPTEGTLAEGSGLRERVCDL